MICKAFFRAIIDIYRYINGLETDEIVIKSILVCKYPLGIRAIETPLWHIPLPVQLLYCTNILPSLHLLAYLGHAGSNGLN